MVAVVVRRPMVAVVGAVADAVDADFVGEGIAGCRRERARRGTQRARMGCATFSRHAMGSPASGLEAARQLRGRRKILGGRCIWRDVCGLAYDC